MEDIDNKYVWPAYNWLKSWRSYMIGFLLCICLFAYIRYEWHQVIKVNRELIMSKAHKAVDETKLLEQLALQGDAFGSVNAWFSGIAMLAAILAIVFQTFEFGHQREELSKTTQAHIDRLEFDRSVHGYQKSQDSFARRHLLIDQLQELDSERMTEAMEALNFLKRCEDNLEPLILNVIAPAVFPDAFKGWKPLGRGEDVIYKKRASQVLLLHGFLHRVALSKWNDEEFANFVSVIIRNDQILGRYANIAMDRFVPNPPPWAVSYEKVLDRAQLMTHTMKVSISIKVAVEHN